MTSPTSQAAGPTMLTRAATAILAHARSAALVAGVISATGFAPLSLWPLTIAAYALLIALIASATSWKRAVLIGWLFGLGQFTLGNAWIATAFTYQAAMPAWLGWVAVVALAIYLAVYPALATLGAWSIARRFGGLRGRRGWPLVFAFAAMWIITEWLRSWVFTGFVWNPLGVALVTPGLADASALLGTYGLGGVFVLASGAFWLLGRGRGRDALAPGLLAAALMIAGFAYRVSAADVPSRALGGRPIAVTVVQPNIPQETKADPRFDALNWTKLARLSPTRQPATPRVLLWPEAAIPDFLEDGYPARYYDMVNLGGSSAAQSRARLAGLLAPGDLLVTGSADLEIGSGPGGAHAIGARNSVTVLTPEARIVGSADKAHLVPYGEYLPMRPLLSALGLSRLVPGDLDFWPGPGARTLDLPGFGKMGVQICYEIIFSGQVVDRANRPDFIFNPSNDAWFGASGPPQHFAQGRLRAIEEGLPVVRSTPTGISGIIDAHGRVVHKLAMGKAGRIDEVIPPARTATLFALFGNIIPLLFAGLLLLLALVPAVRRTATKNP